MKLARLLSGSNVKQRPARSHAGRKPADTSGRNRRVPSGKRLLSAIAVATLVLLLAVPHAWTQSATSVRGTVTDPSGSAVVGATVALSSTESKTERSTTTGGQGEYQFLLLPPGTYTLTVTAAGFAGYEETGLQLLVNTPATANIQLKLGQSTQSVTVTSEAPALNLVDASLGNPFSETQVKQLPLDGRNVPELLSLQAGVAFTGNRPDMDDPRYKDQDTRNGAVNGARSDQSNLSLDGVDVNDQSNGYAFTSVLPVTLDSVQEFRVTTANYNADQGEGSGAQVVLVTKSGTNSLHGSLYEYNRNTATSANDFFIQQAELNDGQPNKPLKLIRNVFGGSLGGPLRKDRLFFFVNYEGTRKREEHSVVRNIPTPSLRDGVIAYQCAVGSQCLASTDPAFQTAQCPQGGVPGMSGTCYTWAAGFRALGPSDIKGLDPLSKNPPPGYSGPVGPNPFMLTYFNQTYGKFTRNDPSLGDGFNYSGFRFRAPFSLDNNAVITRIDYHLTANAKHALFWRGALQNLSNPQEPFLPGSPPEQTLSDHSKGFALGYTAVLSPAIANTFHGGFTSRGTLSSPSTRASITVTILRYRFTICLMISPGRRHHILFSSAPTSDLCAIRA
jgi:hypothetical protein